MDHNSNIRPTDHCGKRICTATYGTAWAPHDLMSHGCLNMEGQAVSPWLRLGNWEYVLGRRRMKIGGEICRSEVCCGAEIARNSVRSHGV